MLDWEVVGSIPCYASEDINPSSKLVPQPPVNTLISMAIFFDLPVATVPSSNAIIWITGKKSKHDKIFFLLRCGHSDYVTSSNKLQEKQLKTPLLFQSQLPVLTHT